MQKYDNSIKNFFNCTCNFRIKKGFVIWWLHCTSLQKLVRCKIVFKIWRRILPFPLKLLVSSLSKWRRKGFWIIMTLYEIFRKTFCWVTLENCLGNSLLSRDCMYYTAQKPKGMGRGEWSVHISLHNIDKSICNTRSLTSIDMLF